MKPVFSILLMACCAFAQPRPVVVTPSGQAQAKQKAEPASDTAEKPAISPRKAGNADDRAMEAKIREKLAKSKSAPDGFTFHVQAGVVTWEGSTEVPQHKGSATLMAKSAGARAVVNNIKVNGSGKRGAKREAPRTEARRSEAR
jgi:hypothetical protein